MYLGDLMTCHKAVRTEVMQALPLRAAGFEIEAEIAARLLQHGERIYEVPVSYRARSSDEGKKLTARDGLRVVGGHPRAMSPVARRLRASTTGSSCVRRSRWCT